MLKETRNVPLVNVYGLTEITPMGTATPWGGDEKPGTVGIPFPNTDLKLVDLETGKTEVKLGEAGEICFKGPQVMMGYYKNPEETSKVLIDGWLYTGDIGVMDADGYVTIVDRKKDMIIASGFNIYPKEIDELLMTHPKILEVCTIGVPDPYRGENVKTFVVVKPGQTMTEEEVTTFCRQTLAAYKIPKMVEFLETLPKSAVGKILRRELRDLEMKKQEKPDIRGCDFFLPARRGRSCTARKERTMILASQETIRRWTDAGAWGHRTLLDHFRFHVRKTPDKICLVDPEQGSPGGTEAGKADLRRTRPAADAVAKGSWRRGTGRTKSSWSSFRTPGSWPCFTWQYRAWAGSFRRCPCSGGPRSWSSSQGSRRPRPS
jgi:hypothetical protein